MTQITREIDTDTHHEVEVGHLDCTSCPGGKLGYTVWALNTTRTIVGTVYGHVGMKQRVTIPEPMIRPPGWNEQQEVSKRLHALNAAMS